MRYNLWKERWRDVALNLELSDISEKRRCESVNLGNERKKTKIRQRDMIFKSVCFRREIYIFKPWATNATLQDLNRLHYRTMCWEMK